jgi:hypothetical protein
VGNCWDRFLTRNGFSMTIPIENHNSGEPLMKKQLIFLGVLRGVVPKYISIKRYRMEPLIN